MVWLHGAKSSASKPPFLTALLAHVGVVDSVSVGVGAAGSVVDATSEEDDVVSGSVGGAGAGQILMYVLTKLMLVASVLLYRSQICPTGLVAEKTNDIQSGLASQASAHPSPPATLEASCLSRVPAPTAGA